MVSEASRITALMGADIMFYPTAIGWATNQDEETNMTDFNTTLGKPYKEVTLLQMEFPVVSVNRVGFEQDGHCKFWGVSLLMLKVNYCISHLTTKKK
ncbi:MAG: hypothetical protein U0T78_07125 [Cloacibacterium normanense]